MIDILASLQAWHWMLLGVVLLGLEALGTRGFLVGAGIAAFVTCLVAISNTGWQVQLGVFVFLSVFFTIIYFRKFRNQVAKRLEIARVRLQAGEPVSGRKPAIIGKLGKVVESGRQPKARVENKTWEVSCKQVLQIDDEVRVRGVKGKTLHVSKLV